MNKKGQILVFFILLIPLIIGIFELVIDLGILNINKNKLNNINVMALEYALNKEEVISEEVKNLVLKNDKKIIFEMDIYENKIVILLKKDINTIFGNIVNIKKYHLRSKYEGQLIEGKIIIKRVGD